MSVNKITIHYECANCGKTTHVSDNSILSFDVEICCDIKQINKLNLPVGWISMEWLHQGDIRCGVKDGQTFCCLNCVSDYFKKLGNKSK